MDRVALKECKNYDYDRVKSAVFSAMDEIGVDIKNGQTVLLKANLVAAHKPEDMVTTHPTVVRAACEYVISKGGKAVIGDSPGSMYTKGRLASVYKATDMYSCAELSGATLNEDYSSQTVTFEKGLMLRRFDIIGVAAKADVIINLAKYKTHSFTGFSAAIKNFYGMIPGLKKVEYHGTHSELDKFSDLLIDIQEYFKDKTILHLVDAVTGMEGAGPTSGTPRDIGRMIAGKSPYACDIVGLKITGNDIMKMPMIRRACERGLVSEKEIEVIGCSIEDSVIEGYKNIVPLDKAKIFRRIPGFLRGGLFKMCTQRPVVRRSKCRGCQKCYEHCPPKAIRMVDGKAHFNYDICIRCFCCQELCAYHVVKVKTPWLAKIFHKLS